MEVTFCVPTFNRKELLSRAIESILCLPFDKKIIISDNASFDSTHDYCKNLVKKYDFITYYRQEENIGFVENTLFVIDKCTTEKIVILADDDYLIKSSFIEFYNYSKNLNSEIVCAKANRIDSSGTLKNTLPIRNYTNNYYNRHESSYFIMSDILMWTSSIFSTDALKESINSLKLKSTESTFRLAIDVAILYYFSKKYGIHYFNKAVMVFYDHENQTSKPKSEELFIQFNLSRVSCYNIINNTTSNYFKSIYLVNLILKARLNNYKNAEKIFSQEIDTKSLMPFYLIKFRLIRILPIFVLKLYLRMQFSMIWFNLKYQILNSKLKHSFKYIHLI